MNHPERLEDYMAGVLGAEDRGEIDRHLAVCTDCRNELEALQRLDTRLLAALAATLPSSAPRLEWVQQVRAGFRTGTPRTDRFRPLRRVTAWLRRTRYGHLPARHQQHPLVGIAGAPSFAVVVLAMWLLVAQPWEMPSMPERDLDRAYAATLQETFQGEVSVFAGGSLELSGTFSHAPEGRWATSLITATGERIEEVQIGEEVWRRTDGAWTRVVAGPLYKPQDSVLVGRVPELVAALPALTGVQNPAGDSYVGVDAGYAERVQKTRSTNLEVGTPPPGAPPQVHVRVSEGKVSSLRLSLQPPSVPPVLVEIRFGGYGAVAQAPDVS